MAPTAVRRAKLVQRNNNQGLQGNPDACHPGRGSACDVTTNRMGGDARLVFAGQTQPTAAMDSGSRAAALVVFPPLLTPKAAPRPGRPPPGGRASTGRADNIRPYRAGSCPPPRRHPPGGWASIERATTGRPYGRRAGSSRPTGQRLRGQTGGYYPPLRAWQLAYRAGQARTLADGGSARGPTPTAKQAAACRGRRPRRPVRPAAQKGGRAEKPGPQICGSGGCLMSAP